MMTHEEIKAAIERVRCCKTGGSLVINSALMGGIDWTFETFRDALIDLLEQADPDTHTELPRDADGVSVHIGDEVESDHCEGGTVVGIQYYEGVGALIAVRPRNWDTPSWCNPAEYRYYHKPTVEDVLVDYYKECQLHASKLGLLDLAANVDDKRVWRDIATTFAEKLREVMADDDH